LALQPSSLSRATTTPAPVEDSYQLACCNPGKSKVLLDVGIDVATNRNGLAGSDRAFHRTDRHEAVRGIAVSRALRATTGIACWLGELHSLPVDGAFSPVRLEVSATSATKLVTLATAAQPEDHRSKRLRRAQSNECPRLDR
jgi:hypothetical protein